MMRSHCAEPASCIIASPALQRPPKARLSSQVPPPQGSMAVSMNHNSAPPMGPNTLAIQSHRCWSYLALSDPIIRRSCRDTAQTERLRFFRTYRFTKAG